MWRILDNLLDSVKILWSRELRTHHCRTNRELKTKKQKIEESSMGTLRSWKRSSKGNHELSVKPFHNPIRMRMEESSRKLKVNCPRILHNDDQIEPVNCEHLSEFINEGTQKEESKNYCTLFCCSRLERDCFRQSCGMLDWGRGPTRSTWTWENLSPGTSIW